MDRGYMEMAARATAGGKASTWTADGFEEGEEKKKRQRVRERNDRFKRRLQKAKLEERRQTRIRKLSTAVALMLLALGGGFVLSPFL